MDLSFRSIAHLVLALALLGAPSLQADAPASAAPDTAPEGGGKYTKDTLFKQLKEMGYETVIDKDAVNVTHKKEGVETLIAFNFGDHNVFMGQTLVNKVKDADKVPASTWFKLLQITHDVAPMHITLVPKDDTLIMYRALSLRPIPNERLDQVISEFAEGLAKHEAAWSEEALPDAAPSK